MDVWWDLNPHLQLCHSMPGGGIEPLVEPPIKLETTDLQSADRNTRLKRVIDGIRTRPQSITNSGAKPLHHDHHLIWKIPRGLEPRHYGFAIRSIIPFWHGTIQNTNGSVLVTPKLLAWPVCLQERPALFPSIHLGGVEPANTQLSVARYTLYLQVVIFPGGITPSLTPSAAWVFSFKLLGTGL